LKKINCANDALLKNDFILFSTPKSGKEKSLGMGEIRPGELVRYIVQKLPIVLSIQDNDKESTSTPGLLLPAKRLHGLMFFKILKSVRIPAHFFRLSFFESLSRV
jgi:hypothetical protein